MAISTSAARRDLVRLIERVNLDRTEVEITSKCAVTSLIVGPDVQQCGVAPHGASCIDGVMTPRRSDHVI
jgi:hypothetical protein